MSEGKRESSSGLIRFDHKEEFMKSNIVPVHVLAPKTRSKIALNARQQLPVGEGTLQMLSSILSADSDARRAFLENPAGYLGQYGVAVEGGQVLSEHLGPRSETSVVYCDGGFMSSENVMVQDCATVTIYTANFTSGMNSESEPYQGEAWSSEWV